MAIAEYLDSMDFTTLRKLILDMAPEDVDKSEGSFMYDAVTPIALFVSEIFEQMKMILEQSFIGTATGTNLDILAATMPRLYRQSALAEKLLLRLSPNIPRIKNIILNNQTTLKFSNTYGEPFLLDVEQDDWFTEDESNIYLRVYKNVTGKGSSVVGQSMEPSPAIEGLSECVIHEITSGGDDEENDDHFRTRVWAAMSSPFLGSLADYQRKIFSNFPLSQNGFNIENCFIIPRGSRSGYICVIPAKMGEDGGVEHCESGELISLQEYLDKRVGNIGGYGMGVAPIGHVVKVRDFSEFKLYQKITVTVSRNRLHEVNSESVSSQIKNATNSYLRSIIDEVIPSASNYMIASKRYISFFIYYYVNAQEYSILSTLRSVFGNDLIKNARVDRKKILSKFNLDDIELSGVNNNVVILTSGGSVIQKYPDSEISDYEILSETFDFKSVGELKFETVSENEVLAFKENTHSSAQTVTDAIMRRIEITPQTDLVIKSGGSKGTLPVLAEQEVEIIEEEG